MRACLSFCALAAIATAAVCAGEEVRCPRCGAEAAREWTFCPFCASRIGAPAGDGKGAGPTAPSKPSGPAVLWDFETAASAADWKALDGCEAVRVRDHATGGAWALKISYPIHPGGAPSLLHEGKPLDFSGYRALMADIRNPGRDPIPLSIKLKSGRHEMQTTQEFELRPGTAETIELPLANIARRIDLRGVTYINFFVWQPERRGAYYMDTIRLSQ